MSSSRYGFIALAGAALAACGGGEPPPPPEPIVRVDTVVVTREAPPPPLPTGTPATVCLASGQSVDVRITSAGDTLIGARRISMRDLGPSVAFAGSYAAGRDWFVRDQPIRLGDREFQKFGTPSAKACNEIVVVGSHMGVNVFSDAGATSPYSLVYVPVSPGMFQVYRAGVGRVRG